MVGCVTLDEVERYTRAADRLKIVKLLMEVFDAGHTNLASGHVCASI
jgi:hypothetical protein